MKSTLLPPNNNPTAEEQKNENHLMTYPGYHKENKTIHGVPLWKLFIDKECHSQGEMFFDRSTKDGLGKCEPGYNEAMHQAFDNMLSTLNKKLDAEEFKNIYHTCIKTVKNVNSNEREFHPGMYKLKLDKISKAARDEWKNRRLIATQTEMLECAKFAPETEQGYLSYLMNDTVVPLLMSEKPALEKITKKVNAHFNAYYSNIKEAKTDKEKLTAIVSLCEALEIGHYFPDGNQRTIVFVMLNKLLIENGFLPVILEDPAIFDGYHSIDELIQDIEIGRENFLTLCTQKQIEKTESPQTSSSTSEAQEAALAVTSCQSTLFMASQPAPKTPQKPPIQQPSTHHQSPTSP